MANFRHFTNARALVGEAIKVTIASGPVIIEKDKVLLDKHGEDSFWKFPGGAQKEGVSIQKNAKSVVKAELGIEVVLEGKPFILAFTQKSEGIIEYFILIHYRARRLTEKITPGKHVREWGWHDIGNLPFDCAPNIRPVVKHFTQK